MLEIKRADFFNRFWNIVERSINKDHKEEFYNIAKAEFEKVDKDFEFSIIPEGTIVKPYVPVFQYKGPKIFGQMIETKVTNIINGKTGFKTYEKIASMNDKAFLEDIVYENRSKEFEDYIYDIETRAKEYRESTSKVLLEAGYRRAPSQEIADIASSIAVKNGWNGTSNVSAYQKGMLDKIGGTMAHAFVMSFEDRIDSGDLKEMSFKVREILDQAGWNEVKIFISGDITPEILKEYEKEGVPFDITMAGTKYVNIGKVVHVNAGFVYKIVEYEKNGVKHYPVKKASGKSNYPGLKKVEFINNEIIMSIGKEWGFFGDPREIRENSKVSFKGI